MANVKPFQIHHGKYRLNLVANVAELPSFAPVANAAAGFQNAAIQTTKISRTPIPGVPTFFLQEHHWYNVTSSNVAHMSAMRVVSCMSAC